MLEVLGQVRNLVARPIGCAEEMQKVVVAELAQEGPSVADHDQLRLTSAGVCERSRGRSCAAGWSCPSPRRRTPAGVGLVLRPSGPFRDRAPGCRRAAGSSLRGSARRLGPAGPGGVWRGGRTRHSRSGVPKRQRRPPQQGAAARSTRATARRRCRVRGASPAPKPTPVGRSPNPVDRLDAIPPGSRRVHGWQSASRPTVRPTPPDERSRPDRERPDRADRCVEIRMNRALSRSQPSITRKIASVGFLPTRCSTNDPTSSTIRRTRSASAGPAIPATWGSPARTASPPEASMMKNLASAGVFTMAVERTKV